MDEVTLVLGALRYVRNSGICNMITEFRKALAYSYVLLTMVWGISPETQILQDIYKADYMALVALFEAYKKDISPVTKGLAEASPGGVHWLDVVTSGRWENNPVADRLKEEAERNHDGIEKVILRRLEEICQDSFRFARDVTQIESLQNCYAQNSGTMVTGARLKGPISLDELYI